MGFIPSFFIIIRLSLEIPWWTQVSNAKVIYTQDIHSASHCEKPGIYDFSLLIHSVHFSPSCIMFLIT